MLFVRARSRTSRDYASYYELRAIPNPQVILRQKFAGIRTYRTQMALVFLIAKMSREYFLVEV